MISRDVEISIAGDIVTMVRAGVLMPQSDPLYRWVRGRN